MTSLTPVKIKGYGYRRDHLDPRDLIYNNEARIRRAVDLAAEADISNEMPPIYDQLQLGTCTCNASGAIMQHCQMVEGEAEGQDIPSRLFLYWNVRVLEGSPTSQDTGAEVRDVIKVLAGDGAPPESEWPYSDADPGPFQEKPPAQAFTDAQKYEAIQYMRIIPGTPGAPIRTAIANHLPVAFGFPVPAKFEDPNWDPATEYFPIPGPNANIIGGHAVTIVGYDWSRSRFPVHVFKIRNSWGSNWGDNGHFYMDARWFMPQLQLADDLWVVSKTT